MRNGPDGASRRLGLLTIGFLGAFSVIAPAPTRAQPATADRPAPATTPTARTPKAATATTTATAGVGPAPAAGPRPTPTFTKDVAPILQAKCQGCHRKDQVGPFALETYDQARKRATDIAAVVSDRTMPPWKPARGVGPKLKHDQSLTPEEVAVVEAWAEADAPKGEAGHMPAPRVHAEGWKLGPPDLILEPAEPYAVAADAPDTYRCFVIPTGLTRDTFLSAVEFRPSNGRVVHHIATFIDTQGGGRRRDEAEPGPGYTSFSGPGIPVSGELGFWAAGGEPHHLPDGIGLPLPRGCDVILQVHYHATGKNEVDRSRLGLYFAKTPVKQALHWNDASSFDLKLPAGQSNVEVKATWFVPVDLEALAVAPHMHLLGHDMTMSATLPNGRNVDLIHIPKWDPSWQSSYYFQKPISLPKGTVVKVLAHFDNSAHARNPNQPPKFVKWGHGAYDEMCVGYIAVIKKGQDLTKPRAVDDLFDLFARQRERNFLRDQSKTGH